MTITTRQQRAISALLTSRSITDAANTAKVSRRALTGWLTDAQFCSELRKAEADAIGVTVRRLTHVSNLAVNALEDVLSKDDSPLPLRIRAAEIVLSRLISLRELHDIEERLSALEAARNEPTKAS